MIVVIFSLPFPFSLFATAQRDASPTKRSPPQATIGIGFGSDRSEADGNGKRIADQRSAGIGWRSLIRSSIVRQSTAPLCGGGGRQALDGRGGANREWATQIAAQPGQGVELGVNE